MTQSNVSPEPIRFQKPLVAGILMARRRTYRLALMRLPRQEARPGRVGRGVRGPYCGRLNCRGLRTPLLSLDRGTARSADVRGDGPRWPRVNVRQVPRFSMPSPLHEPHLMPRPTLIGLALVHGI